MSQKDQQQPDAGNGADWLFEGTGIGTLLSAQRKKKGLDYSQIYLMTRLRPSTLEALENEDWDHLPPPVFVTGYIRSYARALELDEERALELYQKVGPFESRPLRPPIKPPKTRKKLYLPVFLIVPLLALVAAYYVWQEYPTGGTASRITEKLSPAGGNVAKPEEIQEVLPKPEPVATGEQKEVRVAPAVPVPEPVQVTGADDSSGEEMAGSSTEQKLPIESRHSAKVETTGMILKAKVRERTWIRVIVDDQPPKEYIFGPNKYPEWRATEGFELLIGNGGGIDLEFNGKKIENLGDPGQVVRIRLPKDYERSVQD